MIDFPETGGQKTAMSPDDIVLLSVKARVLAISRKDGRLLWTTELPGGLSSNFVSLLADETHVFAHSKGHLHCLALSNGAIKWINELPGCGYGIATLAFPGGTASSLPEAFQVMAEESAAGSDSGAAASASS